MNVWSVGRDEGVKGGSGVGPAAAGEGFWCDFFSRIVFLSQSKSVLISRSCVSAQFNVDSVSVDGVLLSFSGLSN